MYRRRLRQREIAFSFDSFLDVVANVCGVIIRLILVTWVGARSYHAAMATQAVTTSGSLVAANATSEPLMVTEVPPIRDPLDQQLARHRQEMEKQQQRLLEQLRQFEGLETVNTQSAQQLAMLTVSERTVEQQRDQLERTAKEQAGAAQNAQLSLVELEKRSQQLEQELRELEKLPALTKTLRYHTPVSRPVHTEQLHFECRQGRVSFIDIQAFLVEVRHGMEDQVNLLRSQGAVDSSTGPIGAFRLRYTVERENGPRDGSGPDALVGESGFRYGMTGWTVEPIAEMRGESAEPALAANSEFRRITAAVDAEHTVVTLWVYADSFALYRLLRDYLHEHNIEVAGRPLPPGVPIASTRHGSASRGQ